MTASRVINPEDWAETPGRWHGEVEGTVSGAGICLIFNSTREVGAGPRLHRHPYPETFIIRSGRARFTVGDEEIEARAGQILVVAANTPHKFSNPGAEPLETIDIHANDRFVTEWLE